MHTYTHTLAVGIVAVRVCSQLAVRVAAIWPIVVIGSLLILVAAAFCRRLLPFAAAAVAVVDGHVTGTGTGNG